MIRLAWPWLCLVLLMSPAAAQNAVDVTLQVQGGATTVDLGSTVTVQVYGRISPTIVDQSDQIVSWYVDFLPGAGAQSVMAINYASLNRDPSDNFPSLSSSGTTDETGNRTGIYDSFILLPQAGRNTPVLLFSIQMTAQALGQASFSVRAGTGVANLAEDFQVARTTGGAPFTGGNYTQASLTLNVVTPLNPAALRLQISRNTAGVTTLTYLPQAGVNHTIQSTTTLHLPASWADIAGGPHNTGTFVDSSTVGVPLKFYRIQMARQ
jgi:hypothetical protein